MTEMIPQSFIGNKLVGLQARLISSRNRISRFQRGKVYTRGIILFLREELDSIKDIECRMKELLLRAN